jgi:hypothetical protein
MGNQQREEGKKRTMRGKKKTSKYTKDIYEDSLKKCSKNFEKVGEKRI